MAAPRAPLHPCLCPSCSSGVGTGDTFRARHSPAAPKRGQGQLLLQHATRSRMMQCGMLAFDARLVVLARHKGWCITRPKRQGRKNEESTTQGEVYPLLLLPYEVPAQRNSPSTFKLLTPPPSMTSALRKATSMMETNRTTTSSTEPFQKRSR